MGSVVVVCSSYLFHCDLFFYFYFYLVTDSFCMVLVCGGDVGVVVHCDCVVGCAVAMCIGESGDGVDDGCGGHGGAFSLFKNGGVGGLNVRCCEVTMVLPEAW